MATDMIGVSARAIVAAVVEGRADPATMAELAHGRMRSQIPVWEQALTGLVRDQQRQLLALPVAHLDVLDAQIDTLSVAMTRCLIAFGAGAPPAAPRATAGSAEGAAAPDPSPPPLLTFTQAVRGLDTIPGVNQRGAERLVAAWGIDMGRFGTATRLAAWSGVAPGHDESAGTQRSGKTRQGHCALRTGLTPLAHEAARTKGTSLAALSQRLAARRGKIRAIMAVAHSMVVRAFHRLSRHEPYQELGAHDCDARRRDHLVDRLTRRMEHLGYRVTLEPIAAA